MSTMQALCEIREVEGEYELVQVLNILVKPNKGTKKKTTKKSDKSESNKLSKVQKALKKALIKFDPNMDVQTGEHYYVGCSSTTEYDSANEAAEMIEEVVNKVFTKKFPGFRLSEGGVSLSVVEDGIAVDIDFCENESSSEVKPKTTPKKTTPKKTTPKKTKTKSKRKAPTDLAKDYDEGYEMAGNDGEMYYVKIISNGQHRWMKKKTTTKKKTTAKKTSTKKKTPTKRKASKKKPKNTPDEAAKDLEVGEERVGNDGEDYIVKENKNNIHRWAKKNGTKKKTKTTKKKSPKKSPKKQSRVILDSDDEDSDNEIEEKEIEEQDNNKFDKIAKVFKKAMVGKTEDTWVVVNNEPNTISIKVEGVMETDYDENYLKKLTKKFMKKYPEIKYTSAIMVEQDEIVTIDVIVE